jgi:hypothetical protein
MGRRTPGPPTLRQHDAVIGRLREAGFSLQLVAHAISAVGGYTYSFALQERTLAFETPEQTSEPAEASLQQFPSKEYPHLAAFTGRARPAAGLPLRRGVRVRPTSSLTAWSDCCQKEGARLCRRPEGGTPRGPAAAA